jgi:hypothetical protein
MKRSIFLVAGVTLIVGVALAQNGRVGLPKNMPPLLLKALASAPKQRFTGTRVVEYRRGPDTVRYEEQIIRDGSRLRIEFPSDSPYAGQIVVEDGRVRRHFYPDRNEIRILPPRREEVMGRLHRLVKGGGRKFSFVTGTSTNIAGVMAQPVSVQDAEGNVLQRLYIDPRSGVVLKRVLFDHVGTPRGSFAYTRIDLTPNINPSVFQINRRGARIVTPTDALRELVKDGPFVFRMLPPSTGFRLDFSRQIRPEGKPVLMQIYAGRGGRLTLFQLGATVDEKQLKRFGRGQFNTHSWQEDGRSFVLVGPLAQDELARLATRVQDRP